MKYVKFLTICLTCLIILSCSVDSTSDTLLKRCADDSFKVSVDEMLKCDNLAVEHSNSFYSEIGKLSNEEKVVLVHKYWNVSRVKIRMHPLVRLNVIAVAGQLHRQGMDICCVEQMREYARTKIAENEALILSDAIRAIAWIGEEEDIYLLERVARESKDGEMIVMLYMDILQSSSQ